MKKEEDGFSAIEGLLILVIVVIISFIGWYAYKVGHKSKNDTAVSNTQQTNTPQTQSSKGTTLQTYDDSKMTFQYPKNWEVKNTGVGVYSLSLSGPTDKTIIPFYADPTYKKLYIHMDVTEQGYGTECNLGCKVYAVEDVTLKDKVTRKLVISDFQNQGYAQGFAVIDENVTKGADSYIYGVLSNSKKFDIYGTIMADTSSSVRLKHDTDYQSIDSIQVVKTILSSLVFK